MENNENSYNESYIKNEARKLKKQLNIPHHDALNMASKKAGFANWENYINVSQKAIPVSTKSVNLSSLASKTPNPLVIRYGSSLLRTAGKRPNAKMPVISHQQVARLLKEAISIAFFHKRARNPLGEVRTVLDDWVQMEYTDKNELPDAVFFAMYFGSNEFENEEHPSDQRRQEFIEILERVSVIINTNYHNCPPVQWIDQRISLARRWVDKWPSGKRRSY